MEWRYHFQKDSQSFLVCVQVLGWKCILLLCQHSVFVFVLRAHDVNLQTISMDTGQPIFIPVSIFQNNLAMRSGGAKRLQPWTQRWGPCLLPSTRKLSPIYLCFSLSTSFGLYTGKNRVCLHTSLLWRGGGARLGIYKCNVYLHGGAIYSEEETNQITALWRNAWTVFVVTRVRYRWTNLTGWGRGGFV